MKKLFISLTLLLTTALAGVHDSEAGRQRFKVKQVEEAPKGGHRTRNMTRLNDHQIADGRRAREQKAAQERQAEAAKSKTRKQQASKQAAAGTRKKQRGN